MQRSFADRFTARLAALALLGPYGDSRLVELDSFSISACVGAAAGALYATGQAFPMSCHSLIAYLAVTNALELDLALSTSWSLALAIAVLVPLRRTSFVVRDQAGAVLAAHDLSAAGALLAIGPAYHF